MAELLALFRFLVPYFSATSDADVQLALTAAADYRPTCLVPARQDEAQVFYAAWLLYQRQLQIAAGGAAPVPFGIKSEKEGDLSRTYGSSTDGNDPFDFWGRFEKLARLCGGIGAITVGNRYAPCCC